MIHVFGPAQCSNGDLWLVDGLSDNEGRLEFCYNYQWGTVCDDGWTQSSTNVACRQLGIQEMTNGSYMFRITDKSIGGCFLYTGLKISRVPTHKA